MLSTSDMITPLLELGLNKYESRVYLTLVEEGISTAKNISDVTSIPYGKVYEIINGLAAKGFAITMPTKPMKCQAIDPREVLATARKRFEKDYHKLERQINEEIVPVFIASRKFVDAKSVFWMISGRASMNKKIEELIEKSKNNIRFLLSEEGIKRLVIFKQTLTQAADRGARIQICGPLTKGNAEDVASLSFCEFSQAEHSPIHMVSVDGKECLMIEPIPDDDNIVYGRDLGLWVAKSPFAQLLHTSWSAGFRRSRKTRN